MRRMIGLTGALVAAAVVSTGCMMPNVSSGIMGGMDSNRLPAAHAVRVEARAPGVSVTLEFPPVRAGDEGMFKVDVREPGGHAISSAIVMLQVRRTEEDTGTTLRATQSSPGMGLYHVTHRFATAGHYTATAEVTFDPRDPSNVVSVTARQDVMPAMDAFGHRSSVVPLALLTGAVMVGMMVIFGASRAF